MIFLYNHSAAQGTIYFSLRGFLSYCVCFLPVTRLTFCTSCRDKVTAPNLAFVGSVDKDQCPENGNTQESENVMAQALALHFKLAKSLLEL